MDNHSRATELQIVVFEPSTDFRPDPDPPTVPSQDPPQVPLPRPPSWRARSSPAGFSASIVRCRGWRPWFDLPAQFNDARGLTSRCLVLKNRRIVVTYAGENPCALAKCDPVTLFLMPVRVRVISPESKSTNAMSRGPPTAERTVLSARPRYPAIVVTTRPSALTDSGCHSPRGT